MFRDEVTVLVWRWPRVKILPSTVALKKTPAVPVCRSREYSSLRHEPTSLCHTSVGRKDSVLSSTVTVPLNATVAPSSFLISPITNVLYWSRDIDFPLTLIVTSCEMNASKAVAKSSAVLAL